MKSHPLCLYFLQITLSQKEVGVSSTYTHQKLSCLAEKSHDTPIFVVIVYKSHKNLSKCHINARFSCTILSNVYLYFSYNDLNDLE